MRYRKGVILPMSTHAVVNEKQILTPEHVLLTDEIGNEVYASHYAERKAYLYGSQYPGGKAINPAAFSVPRNA